MDNQTEARKVVSLLTEHLNSSTNINYRLGVLYSIGVVEGTFMLNYDNLAGLDQADTEHEAAEDLITINEAHKNEPEELPKAAGL